MQIARLLPIFAAGLLAAGGALLPMSASAQTSTCSPDYPRDTFTCRGTDGSASTCQPNYPRDTFSCQNTAPPISSYFTTPPAAAPPSPGGCQVVDNSPTVKYIPDCGGNITVLCGSLTVNYTTGPKTLSGPPCAQPTTPPSIPAPQVSPSDSYSTSNGVRSSGQIQAELLSAGYAGPFDVPSLLAAYQRTTASPVRPL
jgi:hypothetical protein